MSWGLTKIITNLANRVTENEFVEEKVALATPMWNKSWVALNKLLFNKHYHKSFINGVKENEHIEENVPVEKSNVKINVEEKFTAEIVFLI